MKKFSFKKFLLLFSILACVFSLTACTDAVSTAKAKDAYKNAELTKYSEEIKAWAKDMLNYLDKTSDEMIKESAEKAENLSEINNKDYVINVKGVNAATIQFYNGWIKSREDLGALKSIDSVNVVISSETGVLCMVTVETTYEKRVCTFELTINEDMELESGAINPAYTKGEKLQKAAMNTVIGMGTVFVVLVFISFIISLLKYVNIIGKKNDNKEEVIEMPTAPVFVENTEDFELIAVIAAAIAASEGTSTDGLVVRSIKRRR